MFVEDNYIYIHTSLCFRIRSRFKFFSLPGTVITSLQTTGIFRQPPGTGGICGLLPWPLRYPRSSHNSSFLVIGRWGMFLDGAWSRKLSPGFCRRCRQMWHAFIGKWLSWLFWRGIGTRYAHHILGMVILILVASQQNLIGYNVWFSCTAS